MIRVCSRKVRKALYKFLKNAFFFKFFFAYVRVAPHSFNFFKMLVDKTKDIDDTEAGLVLDFVDNA